MRKELADALLAASNAPGTGLAETALIIAQIEYPQLDASAYLGQLDKMGDAARRRIEQHTSDTDDASTLSCIKGLNKYLFDDEHFVGNRDRYEDPRNSCLNEVIDRRTGIPITLSIVYLEIAWRVGLPIHGINFPGHFLVCVPADTSRNHDRLIIDPFHTGARLSENDCRLMLQKHVGSEVVFNTSLLTPATRQQIIVRMLLNLKRIYVHMQSFPQAREVTDLLLTVTPSAINELRDRGLLAYHLNDFTGALRDLQTYLKLASMREIDAKEREEHQQLWEHVKTLRRRVASLN